MEGFTANFLEPVAAWAALRARRATEVVMAGDTHDFEFCKEVDRTQGQSRPMYHFVNGGGGAYLSMA